MRGDESRTGVGAQQAPRAGALNVDHVAHFVRDIEAASSALERLGFTLTPFSPQSHRLQADGPLVPAGTGNRCVMLQSGYVEFLTATGDSPVADQLRTAMQRYVGLHLIAFGTAEPELDHARLAREGFEPVTPVALQRPVATDTGEGTARFTVVRVPPGQMAEGRIQYCQHHTPELVWQKRWIEHPNAAIALETVLLCVADPAEAVRRYARYTGLPFTSEAGAQHIHTARGTLTFVDPAGLERTLHIAAPTLPWIAGYGLLSRDLAATREHVRRSAYTVLDWGKSRCAVVLPPALGGLVIFQESARDLLRFD